MSADGFPLLAAILAVAALIGLLANHLRQPPIVAFIDVGIPTSWSSRAPREPTSCSATSPTRPMTPGSRGAPEEGRDRGGFTPPR